MFFSRGLKHEPTSITTDKLTDKPVLVMRFDARPRLSGWLSRLLSFAPHA